MGGSEVRGQSELCSEKLPSSRNRIGPFPDPVLGHLSVLICQMGVRIRDLQRYI